MIFRQLRRLLTIAVIATFGVGGSAFADKASDVKFQKDLESLLGAPIKTKRGQMNLRQTKDRRGHVRKQILVGPDFSEVQLDQNGDGSVDYWSITQGKKSVVASEPNRGRFLRLVVSERFPQGMLESTYLLSLDGRKYNLLKSRFVGSSVRYADASSGAASGPGTGTSASPKFSVSTEADAESARVQKILDTGASAAASVDAQPIPRTTDDRFSLVEEDWTNQQATVFGDELVCMATDNGYGRLATLQREWWKVLKFEVDEKADRLTEKLKASAMFADSCKTPENAESYDRMAKALSKVMLSSAKGEAWTSSTSRGRYLRCLENSGLGITAAEMERGFLESMTANYRSYAPITCEIKPGAEGQTLPSETFPGRKQVAVYMSAADEGKAKEVDGSTQNYENVLFHEMIHIAGVSDENIAHSAQACCGDPTDARGVACNKLDLLIAKRARSNVLETFLSRVSGDMRPLQSQLESTFGADDAAKIYTSFLDGLDNYKKGSPPQGTYADGLISSEEFSKCLLRSNAQTCKAQWTSEIRTYADVFFSKQCKIVASGANRKNCAGMTADFKESIAKTIASAMIDTKPWNSSNSDSSNPDPCNGGKTSSTIDFSNSRFSFLNQLIRPVFGFSAEAAEGGICVPSVADIPNCYTPTPNCTGNQECAPPAVVAETGSGVDVAPGPPIKDFTTPGQGQTGDVSQTDGRSQTGGSGHGTFTGNDAVSGGNGQTGAGQVTTSPVPVRRVDSPSEGQTFADDQYRRGTDLVGSATRQMEKVRDSILPRAEAGSGDRTRSSARLDLKENFIPFRPGDPKSNSISIDNPFSEKRSIASIADIQYKDGAKSSAITAGGAGTSGLVTGDTDASGNKRAGIGSKAATGKKVQAEEGGGSSAGSSTVGGSSVRSTASFHDGDRKSEGETKAEVLDGIFRLPYRDIEARLNRIEVSEALINARISIQDATGRVLGSRKPKERYVFAGFDKSLKRSKD